MDLLDFKILRFTKIYTVVHQIYGPVAGPLSAMASETSAFYRGFACDSVLAGVLLCIY